MLDCLKAGLDDVRAAKCPPGSDMSPVSQCHTRSDRIISMIICHGLSVSCLMGRRASPLVRCDYLSYTSAVYSNPCKDTACSHSQYQLSSILNSFRTACTHRDIIAIASSSFLMAVNTS